LAGQRALLFPAQNLQSFGGLGNSIARGTPTAEARSSPTNLEKFMKFHGRRLVPILASAVLGICALVSSPGARAQQAVDPDAQAVLGAMTKYLGGLNAFTVEYAAADEVITAEGEKLQFLHSGEITLQRPGKLHAVRKGAAGVAEIFLDGKTLFLYGKAANAFLQFDASSVDAAVDAVHKLGFDAPGADFLSDKPLDPATTDMIGGTHVGMTFVDGVEVHQLAFRGKDVDWQLWVTAGDKPLPVRYVVTTKALAGAPQFILEMRKWNVAPQIDAAGFTFVAPQGATKLDPASVAVSAIGDLIIKGK
jgi:hypothetical protein